MWNLPRPGIEPMLPALTGGFLTTGLPGKSHLGRFKKNIPEPGIYHIQMGAGQDVFKIFPGDFPGCNQGWGLLGWCLEAQRFCSFDVQPSHQRILWKCRFWFSRLHSAAAFLTSSQMMLMLQVQGPHFRVARFGAAIRRLIFKRTLGSRRRILSRRRARPYGCFQKITQETMRKMD